jgi:ferredoxin
MAAALRGDIASIADLSFDCITCGLCVARCPAELVPPNVALVARRLYGKYVAPRAEHLRRRVEEIEKEAFAEDVRALKALRLDELKARYAARDIEA